MGNCSCKQTFRFKRLIDAVYPSDPEGDGKADAIAKLALYVEHNNVDIPRVCRKVRKIMDEDIAKGLVKRVSVSAQVMHQLLLSTASMEFYVPFVVEAADMLLAREEPEYRISGADLLSALGYQLTVNLDYDSTSRRLLADRCGSSLRAIGAMAAEGVGTQRIDALHCRYSALVSLSNIAAALGPLLADSAETLMQPVLRALLECALEGEQRAEAAFRSSHMTRRSQRFNAAASQLKWITDAQIDSARPISSVVLPLDPDAKDAKYRAACVRALCCIAPCATTASLPTTISAAIAFLSTHQGWSTPTFALVVTRALATTLQDQHRSGFLVAQQITQHLESAVRAADEVVTMLRCLKMVVDNIPMSGSRPVALFTSLSKYVTSSATVTGAEVAQAARETVASITIRSLVQHNVPAVARLLAALCKHIRSSLATAANHADPAAAEMEPAVAPPAKGKSAGLRATSSTTLPSAAVTASTVTARISTPVELLADLATVATALPPSDRRDTGFVAALICVLRNASDARLSSIALLGLARYVARPQVTPDGPLEMDEAAQPLQPYEVEPIVEWVQGYYTSEHAFNSPSKLLGTADLLVCLFRAEAVSLCWAVDVLFDAQSVYYTQQTEKLEGVLLHACIAAAIVRAIAGYLNARDLIAYGEHVERSNLPKNILSFAPPPPVQPPTPARQRSQSLSSSFDHGGGDESPNVFTPLSGLDDMSPKVSSSFNAAEEWQHAAAGSTLGCGLILEADVAFVLEASVKAAKRVATPLSRPTVALYLLKHRVSNPRVAADLAGCTDDESTMRRLMGDATPRVLTPAESSVDLRLDATVSLTPRRVDPQSLLAGDDSTTAWSLRLQSFAKSLGGAVTSRPDVVGTDIPALLQPLGLATTAAPVVATLQDDDAAAEGEEEDDVVNQSLSNADDAAYKNWLTSAAADSAPASPSLPRGDRESPIGGVPKVRLEPEEPLVVG